MDLKYFCVAFTIKEMLAQLNAEIFL